MTIARLSLCVLLLLYLWNDDAHGARMLGELPPCKDVPGGIPNWDCFDPLLTPLPPCDYMHQNPGIDCSTDSQNPRPPRSLRAKAVAEQLDASTVGSAAVIHVPVRKASGAEGGGQQAKRAMLSPCKDLRGGIPGWDCFDPPTTPLPPCDFKHQRAGFDCWPRDPPAPRTP